MGKFLEPAIIPHFRVTTTFYCVKIISLPCLPGCACVFWVSNFIPLIFRPSTSMQSSLGQAGVIANHITEEGRREGPLHLTHHSRHCHCFPQHCLYSLHFS